MLFYIVGHKGWIGQMFVDYCKQMSINVVYSDYRGESDSLLKDIIFSKATHVLCCMGRTHGTLNGKEYTTIDYLQNPETLKENINDNLYVPLKLANFCNRHHIHFTYMGTGCIYTYDDEHKEPFTEVDKPNFFGSNYSIVKGFTNLLMNDTNALHLRIRMPITSEKNPRNFITKITNYEKICSIPNSMSVLDELIPIAVHMMMEKIGGSFNFTNPGVIEHNEILEMYKKYVDTNFTWKNFTIDEQDKILLSKRSNNHLDTTKLEELFTKLHNTYSYLELNEIKKSVEKCIQSYK